MRAVDRGPTRQVLACSGSATHRVSAVVECVQVLLGYREVPREEAAIVSVLNPPGVEQRTTPRVWNSGDCHMKLITFRRREVAKKYEAAEQPQAPVHQAQAL